MSKASQDPLQMQLMQLTLTLISWLVMSSFVLPGADFPARRMKW